VSVDLHIHTTASDGTFTPEQVISHAHQLKLKAIAITDHDTVAGSKEALGSGVPPSLGFLTGVEISATPPPFYPGSGSFHLLGYSIRLDDPNLNRTLEKLQQARRSSQRSGGRTAGKTSHRTAYGQKGCGCID
jgi:predicted metal-dependent phosphoesterase TrpH